MKHVASRPVRRALAALQLSLVLAGAAAAAPPVRPQTTPLEDEHLFIAPTGKPFRSVSGQPYGVVDWFKEADADHDGKLDKAEFRTDAETFFHVLDRNGDGMVTDPEIGWYEKVLVPELD